MNKLASVLLLLLTLPRCLISQEFDFVRDINPFPFSGRAGRKLPFPMLGGLNFPRPQFVDIDGDGDLDLLVQEQSGNFRTTGRIMFFENTGSVQNHRFEWRTDTYLDLKIGNWFKFIDMDGDGDLDFLAEKLFGTFQYWQNNSNTSPPSLTLLADSLRDSNGDLIYLENASLPELADIDCDNDLDLFIGRQAAGTITFYRNIGTTSAGAPLFEFATDNFQGISIVGGAVQSNALPAQLAVSGAKHGASGLSMLDIDNDDAVDIFWGDFFEPSVVFLGNQGSCSTPNISITSREFPPLAPLMTSGFNLPRFADIDGDDDQDMFVSVLGGAFEKGNDYAANFYHYENTGTRDAPVFSLKTTQFISTLDLGIRTSVALADIDADGDLDLFMGNEQDAASASGNARLYHFENIGSATTPQFELASADFLGSDVGFNYAPCFADIDNDGDYDLFVGGWDGKLTFFINSGTKQKPALVGTISFYLGIDVGNYNTPALVDIDGDLDLDLFMGSFFGTLTFYRNNGSVTNPDFELETESYAGIDVGEFSVPFFADVDADNDPDLLIGSDYNDVVFFRNAGTSGSADFVQDNAISLSLQGRSAPALADIDSDGDLDFFSGSERGGLLFYENRKIMSGVRRQPQPGSFALHQNYPNPFNAGTTITFDLTTIQRDADGKLIIYDIAGKQIRSWRLRAGTSGQISWDGTDGAGKDVASGLYFYLLQTGAGQDVTRKMILLH